MKGQETTASNARFWEEAWPALQRKASQGIFCPSVCAIYSLSHPGKGHSPMTSTHKPRRSLCSPSLLISNCHIIHQRCKSCSAETKHGETRLIGSLRSISTSGPQGKEATAHSVPTIFTFGRSRLLRKQTNKQTILWGVSYSCSNTRLSTYRIQTRRSREKSGLIPGVDLTCQERSRPSQDLNRWLTNKIPGHGGSGVGGGEPFSPTHYATPPDDALVWNTEQPSFLSAKAQKSSAFVLGRDPVGLLKKTWVVKYLTWLNFILVSYILVIS